MDGAMASSEKDPTVQLISRRVTQVPPIREVVVKQICVEHFGLNPERIDRLNSYDDKNYRLTKVTSLSTNPYVKDVCPDGYVLKITNAEDTVTPDLLGKFCLFLLDYPNGCDPSSEGQNALLNHYKSKGLPVSELVRSKNGQDLIRILITYATNDPNDNEESTGKECLALRVLGLRP